jgi:flavin reductase (DIM6/NTAB) family NADH-FMN oxidoreductase RutF
MNPAPSAPLFLLQALGRVPSGLFILTARAGERDSGILVSWVQQAGFSPPMITVAIRTDRAANHCLGTSHRFVLNQLARGQKALLRHFARGFAPDEDAFAGLTLHNTTASAPVLADALSYLEAEVASHIDSGDHRILLARVLNGALIHADEEPMIHVRHSGAHY